MYVENRYEIIQLSFGASSLGGVFHDIRETEAIQAVFTAIEHGMNLLMYLLITDIIKPRQFWGKL